MYTAPFLVLAARQFSLPMAHSDRLLRPTGNAWHAPIRAAKSLSPAATGPRISFFTYWVSHSSRPGEQAYVRPFDVPSVFHHETNARDAPFLHVQSAEWSLAARSGKENESMPAMDGSDIPLY
ncbi:MAG TPA: hypothetical protein VEI57_08070 [Nitrospirota bacterium]|nr:hypothetical protein [Nitrospirota bacterium]